MIRRRLLSHAIVVVGLLAAAATARAADDRQLGTASWFGPGDGVATQWCTWTVRHADGCGLLAIQSLETGVTVIAPVVDWCQCYRGTADERIVDLQFGVLAALGLDRADGLYPVATWRVDAGGAPIEPAGSPGPDESAAGGGTSGAVIPPAALPDTAVATP